MTPINIARNVITILKAAQDNTGPSKKISDIQQAAIDIRKAIKKKESKMSWPPRSSELNNDSVDVPQE